MCVIIVILSINVTEVLYNEFTEVMDGGNTA